MSAEKIEKLKKGLTNSQIPENLKQKIREQIARLEAEIKTDEGMTATEVKKEVAKIEQKVDDSVEVVEKKIEEEKEKMEEKVEAKKTTTRKPRTTKAVAKKPTTAKPSQTSKPKRTAMSVAKEIRKEGESWSDARARASKMMKEKTKSTSKNVESELDKLIKLVRGEKNKQKVSGVSGTNLKRDASRKAKPRGARRVTHSGETSNQYGTFSNKLGRKYYESRDRHSDRLAPRYPKNSPYLAEGGYLTDPTFGTFQNQVFATGGGIPNNYEGKTPEKIWTMWTTNQRKHFLYDHQDEFPKELQGFYNSKVLEKTEYSKLPEIVRLVLNMHKNGGQYADGGGVKSDRYDGKTEKIVSELKNLKGGLDNKAPYVYLRDGLIYVSAEEGDNYADYDEYLFIDEKLEDLADKYDTYWDWENAGAIVLFPLSDEVEYAKGGGVRTINGREYSYGRNWTNDHNLTNKGEEHEISYIRKKNFELGGVMATDLAGHTGGGTGGLNAGMPLDGFSNTAYTGLVGETGAMSSGEMFMNGGGVEEWKKGVTIKIDTRQEAEKNKKLLKEYWGKSGRNFEVEKRGNGYVITYEFYLSDKMELGGGLPQGAEQSYMITESLGNPAQHFDMGGDLFVNYDEQPEELSEIVDYYMNKFDDGDYDYEDSQNFLNEVEAIGYTFDYGLDNEPYNLRLIETDMPDYTQMENNYAKGGEMNIKDLTNIEVYDEVKSKVGNSVWEQNALNILRNESLKNPNSKFNPTGDSEKLTKYLSYGDSFKGGGEIRRFNRHEQMDSETREEVLDIVSDPELSGYLTNCVYGLFDGYDYSETENFQKDMAKLKSKDMNLYNRLNKLYQKIDMYKFEKYDNYAKGGGIRRKNGQTYDYGRVWTKDHNEFDKGADHEVNYRR